MEENTSKRYIIFNSFCFSALYRLSLPLNLSPSPSLFYFLSPSLSTSLSFSLSLFPHPHSLPLSLFLSISPSLRSFLTFFLISVYALVSHHHSLFLHLFTYLGEDLPTMFSLLLNPAATETGNSDIKDFAGRSVQDKIRKVELRSNQIKSNQIGLGLFRPNGNSSKTNKVKR